MFFDQDAGSWQLQLWGAQMISQLRLASPLSRLDSRVTDVVDMPFRSRYYPVRPDTPAWYWAKKDGTLVVVIDGSTTLTQGTSLVEGYGTNTVGKTYPGVNPYLINRASYMLQEMREAEVGSPSRIVIFGHSLGGAIAQALHHIVNLDGFKLVTSSITYGAPRTGDETFTIAFYGSDAARVMNSLDPVPLVPPKEGEAPYVRLITPTAQLALWNHYGHSNGGQIVTPDGRRYDATLPTDSLFNPLTSLASWLATLPTNVVTAHSIATYEANLEQVGVNAPPSNPGTTPTTPVERTHTQTNAQIEVEKKRAHAQVQEREHSQATTRLFVPQNYLFRTRKIGKQWTVFFQGNAVAIGPGRRVAKRLAENGNRFAAAMLRQGQADPEMILNAIGIFVAASQDPSSGIAPPIAVPGS